MGRARMPPSCHPGPASYGTGHCGPGHDGPGDYAPPGQALFHVSHGLQQRISHPHIYICIYNVYTNIYICKFGLLHPAFLQSSTSAFVIVIALLFAVVFASAFVFGFVFVSDSSLHIHVHDKASSTLKVFENQNEI